MSRIIPIILTSIVVNFSSSSILSNHDLGPESSESVNRAGPPEVQKNWLSRFLHIKPATKTLCFHVGRGKVRQDLVRLLRDWQRFGVRDVSFDRNTNIIRGRVDKANRKFLFPAPFFFSEWKHQGCRFLVEVLEVVFVLGCNCTILIDGEDRNVLIWMLHRSQDQACIIRHRALCSSGTWATSQPLPCPIHPDSRRSIELPQGRRHRRRCVSCQEHASRRPGEADNDDGGAGLGYWNKESESRSKRRISWTLGAMISYV